jgi:hypothetical protein
LFFLKRTKRARVLFMRARIFARSTTRRWFEEKNVSLFSFFWCKNSRCWLKKTLDSIREGFCPWSRKKNTVRERMLSCSLSLSFWKESESEEEH